MSRKGTIPPPGSLGPCSHLLLVGVDVADGDSRKIELLEVDFDGDRDSVEGEDEEGTLPDNESHRSQREEDPEEAPEAAAGHHDAAAPVGVGIHAVPMHQVFNGWCLRAPHRQILLDFGFDLLSRSHGQSGALQAGSVLEGWRRKAGEFRLPSSSALWLARLHSEALVLSPGYLLLATITANELSTPPKVPRPSPVGAG